MAVIGIMTCEILELEFSRLLGADSEVGRVSVLETRQSARLIEYLETGTIRTLQRLPHVHAFLAEPNEPLEVLIRVLNMGLHRSRQVLRRALTEAAHELRPHVDAFLLGYGLCGNALDDPRAVLDVDLPVFLPMDEGHPIDDCVALCLGGRDRYYAEQCATPGTYFLTPGWSQHWQRMFDPNSRTVEQTGIRRVLAGYERVLLVHTSALAEDELRRRGSEFSERSGLRLEACQGTMEPLNAAWIAAKHCVLGRTRPDEEGASQ